ncbi:uncharacterized protein PG998_008273 [Apiospora kogelbergensis]|uniref:Uncharacterized protein n=1 Tax=Apiospora kogelbergensis TaxID=1337665 RepID=A0AAW0QIL0_9PEZI
MSKVAFYFVFSQPIVKVVVMQSVSAPLTDQLRDPLSPERLRYPIANICNTVPGLLGVDAI